ncbi:MAG: DUF3784 domain-containing protein [Angelakisella sp.]|nr:DUF3784 domain-containing protein [Angelakisella sp.]
MTLKDISNGPDWLLPLITVLFGVLSLLQLLGKGSWLIAGYNTASPEEKKGYDPKRLCRVTGGGMAVITALLAVMTIWKDVLPAAFAKVFGAVTVGVVVVILVLSNTICRRKP